MPRGRTRQIPADFRERDASGATAEALGEHYGVSYKTIQRWRTQTRPTYLSRESGSYRMSGRTQ